MAIKKFLMVMAVSVAASSVWTVLPTSGHADDPKQDCAGDGTLSDLAMGEGTVAISNLEVVVIGNKADGCMYQRTASKTGLLRHVAARAGVGTAYVDDLEGSDAVVMISPQGTQRVSTDGEVTHPSWSPQGELAWAEDFRTLRVLEPGQSEPRSIPSPARATGVFSPVLTAGSITAVAQEPVAPFYELTEDDMLNNLWSFDTSTERWKRVTNFSVTGTRWSAIRTPIVTDAGDVLFVRVHGDALATKAPRFELWGVHRGRAAKLRNLPTEMFLAGMRDGRLMWNVFSRRCGDWELLVEKKAGGLRHVGCGAVMVDPVNLVDPDLMAEGHGAEEHGDELERSAASDATFGVVVGDFDTRAQAERVARRIPGSDVVGHKAAPAAVRPGAFAVTSSFHGAPGPALARVRRLVPDLKHMVFLAPLDKL